MGLHANGKHRESRTWRSGISAQVRRHGISKWPSGGGVGVLPGCSSEAAAYRVVFDIAHARLEFVGGEYLAFVEAAHPDVKLAFQTEGESSLDVLHCFLKRNVGRGREYGVEMVGHDDEGMQKEAILGAVVEEGLLQQFGICRDLGHATSLGGNSCDKKGACFLRRKSHGKRIRKKSAAKAAVSFCLVSGA